MCGVVLHIYAGIYAGIIFFGLGLERTGYTYCVHLNAPTDTQKCAQQNAFPWRYKINPSPGGASPAETLTRTRTCAHSHPSTHTLWPVWCACCRPCMGSPCAPPTGLVLILNICVYAFARPPKPTPPSTIPIHLPYPPFHSLHVAHACTWLRVCRLGGDRIQTPTHTPTHTHTLRTLTFIPKTHPLD